MTAWTRTKGVAAKRDHVSWSSEPGRVSGTIIAIHTGGIDYTGHPHHAGQDDSAMRFIVISRVFAWRWISKERSERRRRGRGAAADVQSMLELMKPNRTLAPAWCVGRRRWCVR